MIILLTGFLSDSPCKTVCMFYTQWTHVYFRLASVARTISQTPLHQRKRDEAFDFSCRHTWGSIRDKRGEVAGKHQCVGRDDLSGA